MKLVSDADMPPDAYALLCRESRLAGVVGLIVWCCALTIPPLLGWHFHHPWLIAIGVIVAIVFILALTKDLAARFRETNWIMRVGADGAWINLSSYRDKDSKVASILHLDYTEIESARRHTEKYSTPSSRVAMGGKGD